MYRTAFDYSEALPSELFGFTLVVTLQVAVGVGLALITLKRGPGWLTHIGDELQRDKPIPAFLPWLWLAFSLVFFAFLVVRPWSQYLGDRSALAASTIKVVEGQVQEHALNNGKQRSGHFKVQGVRFGIGDEPLGSAFQVSRGHEAVALIRDGLAVRVAYIELPTRNAILKLEVDAKEPIPKGANEPDKDTLFLVFPLFAVASFIPNLWFARKGHAALKRRWFAPFALGHSAGLIALFLYVQVPAFVLVFFAVFGLLSLRTTALCDCGVVVRSKQLWSRPTHCKRCDATLGADSQPWLRWF